MDAEQREQVTAQLFCLMKKILFYRERERERALSNSDALSNAANQSAEQIGKMERGRWKREEWQTLSVVN